MQNDKLSDELKWRGMVGQTTYKDLSSIDGESVSFYWGVDPSADSMTVGNLAAAMMVKQFIKHGHKAFLLVGGATGLIGDPDGKAEERNLKSPEEIERNKQVIVAQYKQIFGDHGFEIVDNLDWFRDFRYLDFLREVGKHVPMRQMLAREFIQTRLGDGGAGISYAEFSYVLIQAFDFLHLYKDKQVTLQVCGSDQWGNSIAGVDLIRREIGGEANVYSVPLIVNKATGVKFGKSEGGAVWLDPAKTSPTKFYQFWVNMDDDGAEDYLKIFTELSKEEIENIVAEHKQNPSQRIAQKRLAQATTSLVHGQEAAEKAQKVTEILIEPKLSLSNPDSDVLAIVKNEISCVSAKVNDEVADVLAKAGLVPSKSEGRRVHESGGVYINGENTFEDNLAENNFINGRLVIRRGKKFEDSALVELEN